MDDLVYIIIIIILVVVIIFFIVRTEYPSTQVTPTTNEIIITPNKSGCAGSIYGCCPNSSLAKYDYMGKNCYSSNPFMPIQPVRYPSQPYQPPPPPPELHEPPPPPEPHDPKMGGCGGTIYGCCPNSSLAKHDNIGSNCTSFHPVLPPQPPILSRDPPHFPITDPTNLFPKLSPPPPHFPI